VERFAERPVRFPKNAPADFYTTGQCCACNVPEEAAPDLLAPLEDGNLDTYFVRQPRTSDEIERACKAITVCCANALRYGGADPEIIRRLGNRHAHCDQVLPGGPVRFPGEPCVSWSTAREAARPPPQPQPVAAWRRWLSRWVGGAG
jgi:hypothetical protein